MKAAKRERKVTPPANAAPAESIGAGGLFFAPPRPAKQLAKRERPEKPKAKIDPHLVAKARELRDRCLERQDEWLGGASSGKYDVSRLIDRMPEAKPIPLLKAG